MIGLLCFILAVLASPFKSKTRLEAERNSARNGQKAGLKRYSLIIAAMQQFCLLFRQRDPYTASRSIGRGILSENDRPREL